MAHYLGIAFQKTSIRISNTMAEGVTPNLTIFSLLITVIKSRKIFFPLLGSNRNAIMGFLLSEQMGMQKYVFVRVSIYPTIGSIVCSLCQNTINAVVIASTIKLW